MSEIKYSCAGDDVGHGWIRRIVSRIGLHNHASCSEKMQGLGTFLTPFTLPRSNLGGEPPHCAARFDSSTPKPSPPVTRPSPYLRAQFLVSVHIQLLPTSDTPCRQYCIFLPSLSLLAIVLLHSLQTSQPTLPRNIGQILFNSAPPPACIHRRRPTSTVIPTLLAYSARSPASSILPPCLTPRAVPPPS
jgi:hypothetical protein